MSDSDSRVTMRYLMMRMLSSHHPPPDELPARVEDRVLHPFDQQDEYHGRPLVTAPACVVW